MPRSFEVMGANPEVTAWFDSYEHPAKDAMLLCVRSFSVTSG